MRMIVIERAEMTAKRSNNCLFLLSSNNNLVLFFCHRILDGSTGPGFKPIGLGRGKQVDQLQLVKESESDVQSRIRKRHKQPTESEVKIAEKKARLAKYGVKFESAGHLASIRDEPEHGGLTSYQALLLNSSALESSKTQSNTTSSSNIYSGRFVSATMPDNDYSKEEDKDLTDKRKELSEHLKVVGATKRKLERLEKDTEEAEELKGGEDSSSKNEEVSKVVEEKRTLPSSAAGNAGKKPTMSLGGGKFKIKLAGKRYESFYY